MAESISQNEFGDWKYEDRNRLNDYMSEVYTRPHFTKDESGKIVITRKIKTLEERFLDESDKRWEETREAYREAIKRIPKSFREKIDKIIDLLNDPATDEVTRYRAINKLGHFLARDGFPYYSDDQYRHELLEI